MFFQSVNTPLIEFDPRSFVRFWLRVGDAQQDCPAGGDPCKGGRRNGKGMREQVSESSD